MFFVIECNVLLTPSIQATDKVNKLKAEKELLESSVQELQRRLTEMESAKNTSRRQSVINIMAEGSFHPGEATSSMEAALKRGEREKQMELLVS